MKPIQFIKILLTIWLPAIIWFVNGLFCKVLNFVPRHQEIVSEILGKDYSPFFTKTIGFLELMMVVWIFSRIKSRWCVIFQIFVIALMNVIEFTVVPHLLLFGRFNILVALFFIGLLYLGEFVLKVDKSNNHS